MDDIRNTLGHYFSFGSGIFSGCSKEVALCDNLLQRWSSRCSNSKLSIVDWEEHWLICIWNNLKPFQCLWIIEIQFQFRKSLPCENLAFSTFFVREVQKKGEVTLIHCKSEEQLAYLLTKPLPFAKFGHLRHKIGVSSSYNEDEC